MNEKSENLLSNRVYLYSIVSAAIIAAVGDTISLNFESIFGNGDALGENPSSQEQRDTVEELVDEQLQNGSVVVPGAFGRWEERQKDANYQARSDGIVAAYTGGNTPADEFVIEVGEANGSGLISWNVRTRAGRYDGTVLPVAAGNYWRVRSFDEGSITVSWLPISNP